jgi:hypothetical protein
LQDGTTGLNVVTTFRQKNGLSAALVNTPTLTGPAGFLVPADALPPNGAGGAGADGGSNHISAVAQSFMPQTVNTTFGRVGGIFASGFAGLNNDNANNSAFYPGNPPGGVPSPMWGEPFYVASVPYTGVISSGAGSPLAPPTYLVGPPAVPFFNDGTFPTNFAGYMSGFAAFEVKPAAGTYTLNEIVPTTNSNITFTASATMTSVAAPLAALPTPTFVEDGKGGGVATLVVPPDGRIVETLIYVVDVTNHNLSYTSKPISGTGTVHFVLADNLGPCSITEPGCQTSNPGKSINPLDFYLVYAASFDYKQLEAEPPGNLSQLPTIKGASGQADVTLSPILGAQY